MKICRLPFLSLSLKPPVNVMFDFILLSIIPCIVCISYHTLKTFISDMDCFSLVRLQY
jgi:hypothetical protein